MNMLNYLGFNEAESGESVVFGVSGVLFMPSRRCGGILAGAERRAGKLHDFPYILFESEGIFAE